MKIAVVGGGIVGLSTAFELSSRGHSVHVFDPNPASGASHFAGGMLAPAAEVQFQQDPLFPLMKRAGELWPDMVRRVAQHTSLPTGYRTEGTLVVAADRADAEHLKQLRATQEAAGMDVRPITTRQARGLEPALGPRLSAAVHIPNDNQVAPRVFLTALLDALDDCGVEVIKEEITDLEPLYQQFEVVVLAAGLGAQHLSPIPLALRPVRGDILRVQTEPGAVNMVVRGWVNDRPIYIIPRANGEIAIGATSREDERDLPSVEGIYDLLRDAIRVVPGIVDSSLIEANVGVRPGTPDDLPYLGWASDRLIISTGYFRHGILLSALGAHVTACLIDGTDPGIDLTACAPDRHHNERGETHEHLH
ncbi:glycine oxidase ThiO [Corynebacterium diphtheriae]